MIPCLIREFSRRQPLNRRLTKCIWNMIQLPKNLISSHTSPVLSLMRNLYQPVAIVSLDFQGEKQVLWAQWQASMQLEKHRHWALVFVPRHCQSNHLLLKQWVKVQCPWEFKCTFCNESSLVTDTSPKETIRMDFTKCRWGGTVEVKFKLFFLCFQHPTPSQLNLACRES